MLILILFIMWSNPPDYQQMDVPLLFLGAKYQNLWERKKNKVHQMDNNVEFFLHIEALCDVIRRTHRIWRAIVHRYAAFIIFQAGAHNIVLEPKNDPTKQAHNVGFMITYVNVDAIV